MTNNDLLIKKLEELIKNLKNLNEEDLLLLSDNIRNLIYNITTTNGGHLSANLGIVELVVAIYYIFNMEKTKLIFDVGHQGYAHKILSGRLQDFPNLRTPEGLSGFINSSESKADFFESGHAGVSLSFLYGLIKDDYPYFPITILGDGAFANGINLSILNKLSKLNNPALIIINNNKMNITKSEGRIYDILNDHKKSKDYFTLFDLDFSYQKDGNNLSKVIKDLTKLKNIKKPTIYLIETIKNYGYDKDDLGFYHAVSKKEASKDLTWDALVGEKTLKFFNKAYIVQSGMTVGMNMNEHVNKYKEKYIDLQMNEESSVLVAKGLLESGKKVILPFYSTFMQRAYDQILNDIGRADYKPLLLVNRTGFIDTDDSTHQGIYNYHMQSEIPNLNILVPLNSNELELMLDYYFKNDLFISINYSKEKVYNINYKETTFNMDWSKVKSGNKVCVISYGNILEENFNDLIKEDITLINARVQNIIDEKLITDIINHDIIYMFEESVYMGSLYARLLEYLNQKNYKGKIIGNYITKKVLPFNTRKNLLKINNLDNKSIIGKVKQLMKK